MRRDNHPLFAQRMPSFFPFAFITHLPLPRARIREMAKAPQPLELLRAYDKMPTLKPMITRREFLVLSAAAASAAFQTPPPSAGPADAMLVEDLVAANRVLVREGVLDGFGHVSVRHDRNPNRFLI